MFESPLSRYVEALRKKGGSAREFARAVGVHPSRMSRYLSGEAIPANDIAAAMETASNGEVPASYWVERAGERRRSARRERKPSTKGRRPAPRRAAARDVNRHT